MSDLAVVGIEMTTASVERGEKIVVQAFGNMAAARAKEAAVATATGRTITEIAEREAYAIKETARALNAAGVSSLEFSRTMRAMGADAAFVTKEINATSAASRAQSAAILEASKAVQAQEQVVAKATPGLKSLQTNLGGLAIAASGIPGPVGRTAQALSTFAFGGGWAVGIIAGISAIAYAYEKITEPTRHAKEETEKLIERMDRMRKARLGIDLQEDVDALTKSLKAANAEVAKLQVAPLVAISSGGGAYTGPNGRDTGAVERAKAEQKRIQRALDEAALARNTRLADELNAEQDIIDQANELKRKAAERAAADAKRIRDQELRETKEARDRIADLISGTGSKGNTLLVPGVVNTGSGLSANERILKGIGSKPLLAPQALEATGKAVESSLSVAYDEAARSFQRGMTSAIEGVITGAPDLGRQLGTALASGMAGILAATLTDAISRSMAGKLFGAGVKDGVGGLSTLFQSQKVGNIGSAIAGAGIGYASGNTAAGAIGGAGAGFALGGPAGAAVGAVAGIVGGLFGAADKAKEAAARMEEARKAFAVSLKGFTDEAYGTATTISRAIDAATKAGEDLKKQAPPPVLAGASKEDVQKFVKDLDLYVASLGKVDAATAAYVARLKDEETVRIQLIELSLTEREAKLAGNDRAALEARAAREEAEVQRQVRNGEISQAIASRTSAVIQGELNKSIEDLGKAARDASAALAESLVTRELQARARMASSDAETMAIEDQIRAESNRLEVEKAVKDGVDAAVIANLQRIQGLEDEAVAMERAKKAEEDRLRIVKESTAFLNDLKARELRATGQGAAADEYAQRQRDQDELVKAATFGTQYVMETLRVQGLERADRDAQRRAQQEAAYTDATATSATSRLPDSRTSVNLAVGTSESTTNRLVGVMQSQLVYQLQIAGNTAEAAVLLRRIANAIDRGAIVEVVDEGLALAGSQADLGAGLVPGNR